MAPKDTLSTYHWTQADLRKIVYKGKTAILKTFKERNFFYRIFIARFLLSREYKKYKRLKGIKGIPQVYAKPDKDSLIIENIDGKPLSQYKRLPADFFVKLSALVKKIHQKGIVHLDLGNNSNIILGVDGLPYIIDFASALEVGVVFIKFFSWIDNFAILKHKVNLCPEGLSQKEKQQWKKVRILNKFWKFHKIF